MKIGILKETKNPVDNRVILSPKQIIGLAEKYKNINFIVQSSDVRAFSNKEYSSYGIEVRDDISDCDILFGIKEVNTGTLIPNKHYFFFGHIAKMQPYNRPLLKKMMELNITFTDYEYLVDNKGQRLTAFGWWAGVVGAYNTLRAYGLRENIFELQKPDTQFTLKKLLEETNKNTNYSNRIVITGRGRSSQGAQYVLNNSGYTEISNESYISGDYKESLVYTVAYLDTLVSRKDVCLAGFNHDHFKSNPRKYKSEFLKYARVSDSYISCHFWGNDDPVYLTEEDLKGDIGIKVIGDVTCDILGSIKSTIRPSTHDAPFYDYNPETKLEEPAFSSKENITVMAVDTLPNALAIDTSVYFGEALIEHVLKDIFNKNMQTSHIIKRATILKDGDLTESFSYLARFAEQ